MDEEKSIDVVSINELDPKKLYHVTLEKDATMEVVQGFAQAAGSLGLKCLVTKGGYKFRDLKRIFSKLSYTKRQEIKSVLDEPDAPNLILPN